MSPLIDLARHSALSFLMYLAARAANVIIFIIVGRSAGPNHAGILSLALTYLLVFSVFTRGLDELVTRQAARHPEQTGRYLGSFVLLRTVLATGLYLLLLGVIYGLTKYPPLTRQTIALMGLSLVPDSVAAVGQAILISQRRFGVPTLIALLTCAIRVGGGLLIMTQGGTIQDLAAVWGLGAVVGMVLILFAAQRSARALGSVAWLDLPFLIQQLRPALPFLGISLLMATEFQLDVILLSFFHNETQVGWYNAATTVTATLATLSHAYRMAIYPWMARYAVENTTRLEQLYMRSMRGLTIIVLPMAVGIALLAPQIVNLLFKDEFGPTVPVLQILALALVFIFLNVPNTRLTYIRDRQGQTTLFLMASMATNILLNLVLDGPFGAQGAAWARVCSSAVFFGLGYWYVSRRLLPSNLLAFLYKPALAVLGMAGVVWALHTWPLPASILVGALTYVGLLLALRGIPAEDMALIRRALVEYGWLGGRKSL